MIMIRLRTPTETPMPYRNPPKFVETSSFGLKVLLFMIRTCVCVCRCVFVCSVFSVLFFLFGGFKINVMKFNKYVKRRERRERWGEDFIIFIICFVFIVTI